MLSLSSRSILKRSFSIYRPAARFYTRTTHDKDPDVLKVENQHATSTSVPIPEAPGWKEHLATSSEAHVKADKSGDTVATLVTKTVERIHAQHSPEDRLGSREAPYERDSVEGPLGTETPESPGPKVNKIHLYEEMLEHATPSEAAVKSDRGEV